MVGVPPSLLFSADGNANSFESPETAWGVFSGFSSGTPGTGSLQGEHANVPLLLCLLLEGESALMSFKGDLIGDFKDARGCLGDDIVLLSRNYYCSEICQRLVSRKQAPKVCQLVGAKASALHTCQE